jgi:hypothetical protein
MRLFQNITVNYSYVAVGHFHGTFILHRATPFSMAFIDPLADEA